MRTITTPQGTHEADFGWAPTFDGRCMFQIHDTRRVPAIAEEFDGLDSIAYHDDEPEMDYRWTWYNHLDSVTVTEPGKVQITLSKEVSNGGVPDIIDE